MADSTALATQPQNQISFAPRNLQEAFQFADMVLESGMAPKAYIEIFKGKTGEALKEACQQARSAVVVALQLGIELGFAPMQSLQCIANINGNPSVWGDAALALVMSSGLLEKIEEDDFETIKANKKAVCVVKRKGDPVEKKITFTYEDAKAAGILDRGVWKTYPYRMCLMRARGFALRDKFPDVLKGLKLAEEVMDYDVIDATPPQPKPVGQIKVPTVTAETTIAEVVLADKKPAPTEEAAGETQAEPAETQPEAHREPQPGDPGFVDPEEQKALAEEAKQWATGYYAAYKASGKTPEESKAFLKKHFNDAEGKPIEDSRQVPVAKREFAMEQAKAGFPSMKE
jgi:hypothetical protein